MPESKLNRNAVVVYANRAQFGPAQVVVNGPVASRMLLWCLAGTGTVTVNRQQQVMETGTLLLLPWLHTIRYQASADDPFLLGGIHIIPDHDTRHPVQFWVAHNKRDPLAGAAWRRDAPLRVKPGLNVWQVTSNAPLVHLMQYVVAVFIRGEPSVGWARQMAGMLLDELARIDQHPSAVVGPPELERMKEFVRFHMDKPVSLRDLAEFARLSPATVGRLFRQHLRTTPVAHILRVKMERAQVLLRTRRHSVAEVATAVGFADPYYFSKCFKKHTGQSPQEYRKTVQWL